MKHILIIILFMVSVFQMVSVSSMVHPMLDQPQKQNKLQSAAIKVGIGNPGETILAAVAAAAQQTGLSQELLLSLMYSESSFKPNAVSSKQYQGLMQIPWKIPYQDVNVLIGAKIFTEKLKQTNGDYRKAVTLYKGWAIDHPEGRRQADKVIVLARKLKEI